MRISTLLSAVLIVAASFSLPVLFPSIANSQNLAACSDSRVAGKRVLQCPDGMYEWQRINGRSILVKIQVVSDPLVADQMRAASERPRYQVRPVSGVCFGRNAHRYARECEAQRNGTYGHGYRRY